MKQLRGQGWRILEEVSRKKERIKKQDGRRVETYWLAPGCFVGQMAVPFIKADHRKLGGSKTLGTSVAGLSRLTLHYQ